MQVLPLALFLVLLELTAGSFISLFLLDVRGDSSRNFIIFQGVLYALVALLTLGAMNAFAAPQIVHGYGLDEPWLAGQGPLTLALLLLMIPWNVLLWLDKVPRGKGAQHARSLRAALAEPPLRVARFALGALTSLVALADLFVVGMAYRALAASRLDGALVVLAVVAGAIALGGVMTAMLLGHWYLNTPTASGKPLEFVTTLTLVALVLEMVFLLFVGPATVHATLQVANITPGTVIHTSSGGVVVNTPTAAPTGQGGQTSQQPVVARQTPIATSAMFWLEFILGFLAPLGLGGVALYLTRGRSFQSATGMLYLCVSFIFIGEILARGLLLFPIFG
ncbi:MAG TPA: hypothetical protein VE338_10605 [Ktedonobacterales bacterium]|jgi:hypothetical protein|nr:hypothetical protein [Ktedonobacterales bacterium]